MPTKKRIKTLKLHLGCGSIILPGFVNVDAVKLPGVDVVTDLSDLSEFKNSSADVIYSSHHLEHFPTDHVPKLLGEYFRVLKPGGQLKIAVPDLDAITETYVRNKEWFTPPHNPWLGLLYGGQDYEYNFHKTGFNYLWLKYLLEKAGFIQVSRFKPSEELGYRDASFANKPFNVNVSLNVQARKGPASQIGTLSPEFQYSFPEKLLTILENRVLWVETKLVNRRLTMIHQRVNKGRK